MSQLASTEVAAFGKLPWASDFLSTGTSEQTEPFIQWLENGIAQGGSRGEEWKRAFDAGAQKGFLYRGPTGETLVGVIAPSRDAVGRRFPFTLISGVPTAGVAAAGHALPLSLGAFLHSCGVQIEAMAQQQGDLPRLVRAVPPPDLNTLSSHLDAYVHWTHEAPLRMAGQAIFGANWRDGLANALYVSIESARSSYGQDHSASQLAVRLPVGSGLAGATALWLHVLRLCGGWDRSLPTTVWSFDPYGASVTIFVGQVSGASFADLWERTPSNETLSDLVQGSTGGAAYLPQIRPDLAQIIQTEGAVVADLLAALAIQR